MSCSSGASSRIKFDRALFELYGLINGVAFICGSQLDALKLNGLVEVVAELLHVGGGIRSFHLLELGPVIFGFHFVELADELDKQFGFGRTSPKMDLIVGVGVAVRVVDLEEELNGFLSRGRGDRFRLLRSI